MKPIRVLLVDDSAVVRQVLTELLTRDAGIQVIGAAADPIFALQRMEREWPDVIILDVEMPRMDGLTFLRRIMAERPTPVIICSSLTERGTGTSIQALAAGAVEVIAKPKVNVRDRLRADAAPLLAAVKAAAHARVRALHTSAPKPLEPRQTADAVLAPASGRPLPATAERLVAIGASTGGTQALERILTALPAVCPGIVIVQHMPAHFTAAFAERLDRLCQMEVREAHHRDAITNGRVLIAPGGRHLLVRRSGARYHVEIVDGPLVSRHRPSVDVLFRSVARAAGANALGIILTGMGDDGAAGMRELFDTGAATLAQDEKTCVVYGMPKEAVRRGGVRQALPLDRMAESILAFDRGT